MPRAIIIAMAALHFSDLDYKVDFDDRVVCNGCPNAYTEQAQEFLAADKAQALLDSEKPVGFHGDKLDWRGKWAVISWGQLACTAGLPTMPAGTMHRCGAMQPPGYIDDVPVPEFQRSAAKATKQASKTEKQWWEE